MCICLLSKGFNIQSIFSFTIIADSYVLQVQKYEVPSTHSSINSGMKLPSVKPVTTPSKMSVSMPPKSNTPSLSKSPISAGTPLIKLENEATPNSPALNQKPAGGTQVKLVRGTTNTVQGSAGNSQALSLVRVQNNQAKSVGTPTSATSVARSTSKPQQIVMVMSPSTNKGELGKVTFTTTQTVTLAQGQKTYTAAELNQIIQLSQQGTALKIVSMANQASSSADTPSQAGVKLVQRQANGQVIIKMVSSGQSTSTVTPSSTAQTKTLDVAKIKSEQSNTTSVADSSVSSTVSTSSTGTAASTTAGTADSTVSTTTDASTTVSTITGKSAITSGSTAGTSTTVGTTTGKTAVTSVGTSGKTAVTSVGTTAGASATVGTTTGKTAVSAVGTIATTGTTNHTTADTTTADTTTGTVARTTDATVTSSTQVISATSSANKSLCTALVSITGNTTLSSSQTNKTREQTSNSTANTNTTTSPVTSTRASASSAQQTGHVSQGSKIVPILAMNATISKPPASSVSNAVSSSTSRAVPDSSGKPGNEESDESVDRLNSKATSKPTSTTPTTIPSSKTDANGLRNTLPSQSISSTTSTAALAGPVTISVPIKSDLQKIATLAASTKLENPATIVSRPVTCGGTTTQQSTAPTTTTPSRDMGPPATTVNSGSKVKSAARAVGRLFCLTCFQMYFTWGKMDLYIFYNVRLCYSMVSNGDKRS